MYLGSLNKLLFFSRTRSRAFSHEPESLVRKGEKKVIFNFESIVVNTLLYILLTWKVKAKTEHFDKTLLH